MRMHRSLALVAGVALTAVLSPHAADAASPHLGRHATKPTDLGANGFGTNVMSGSNGFTDTGGGSSPTDLATTTADTGHGKLDHSKMTFLAGAADNLGAAAAGHIAPD